MTRKTVMLCSAAAVAMAGGALLPTMAMADPVPVAASYADLLEPVPDAMARLHADDARQSSAQFIPAQFNVGIGVNLHDHHHHHHHRHSAWWYRHHGYAWNGQVWVIGPPPPPPYWRNRDAGWYRNNGYSWDGRAWRGGYDHHHHHHHHHHHWR